MSQQHDRDDAGTPPAKPMGRRRALKLIFKATIATAAIVGLPSSASAADCGINECGGGSNACQAGGNTCSSGEVNQTGNDCNTPGATNTCNGQGSNICSGAADNSCKDTGANNSCTGPSSNSCGRNYFTENDCKGATSFGSTNSCSGEESNTCTPGTGIASNECNELGTNECDGTGANTCSSGTYVSNKCSPKEANSCDGTGANTCHDENTCTPGDILPL